MHKKDAYNLQDCKPLKNRVGGKQSKFSSYFCFPTSHTTVHAGPHTAVPYLQ